MTRVTRLEARAIVLRFLREEGFNEVADHFADAIESDGQRLVIPQGRKVKHLMSILSEYTELKQESELRKQMLQQYGTPATNDPITLICETLSAWKRVQNSNKDEYSHNHPQIQQWPVRNSEGELSVGAEVQEPTKTGEGKRNRETSGSANGGARGAFSPSRRKKARPTKRMSAAQSICMEEPGVLGLRQLVPVLTTRINQSILPYQDDRAGSDKSPALNHSKLNFSGMDDHYAEDVMRMLQEDPNMKSLLTDDEGLSIVDSAAFDTNINPQQALTDDQPKQSEGSEPSSSGQQLLNMIFPREEDVERFLDEEVDYST